MFLGFIRALVYFFSASSEGYPSLKSQAMDVLETGRFYTSLILREWLFDELGLRFIWSLALLIFYCRLESCYLRLEDGFLKAR